MTARFRIRVVRKNYEDAVCSGERLVMDTHDDGNKKDEHDGGYDSGSCVFKNIVQNLDMTTPKSRF